MLRQYNTNLDVKPFDILSCVDYGDVSIVPGYIERSYEAIEATVAPIVEAGVVPLLIGGDHACTLPHLRATRSRGPVAVIDFDSHTDAWDSYFGEKYNHGTWMRRAIEEGLVDVAHSIEVGLRGSVYGAERLDGAARRARPRLPDDRGGPRHRAGGDGGTRSASGSATPPRSSASTSTSSIRRSRPGTGTPEPGGLSAHDALAIVRRLTGIDFVGFDVVEVIPAYDPAGQTAFLAANLAYEMLSLVAAQALGVVGDLARRPASGRRRHRRASRQAVANRSRSRTTTSASLPTSSVPRRSSAKYDAAASAVHARTASSTLSACAGPTTAPDTVVRRTAEAIVSSGRYEATGASLDSANRTPASMNSRYGCSRWARSGSKTRQPGVTGVPEVARLADDHHPERCHPRDLVGSRPAAMLDAVAVVVAGMGRAAPPRTRRARGRSPGRPGRGRRSASRRRARRTIAVAELVLRRPVQRAR